MPPLRRLVVLTLVALVSAPGWASADGCFPVARAPVPPARVQLANLGDLAAIPAGATLQLTFLGHSSFLIETARGVTAVTDYNAYVRAPAAPDVVTMNNAHDSHYTDFVDPAVRHALRGWNPEGGEARHDVTLEDLRVRNIPTSVHGRSGAQGNSNSIFVFEAGDLCVAHLGHLHHELTREHLGELGQIDVVLVPIDGAYTMAQDQMARVVDSIGAPLVIPMHYFGSSTLGRFLALAEASHEVVMSETPTVALSRATLPADKRVLVLPGR